jgi:phosphopantothenoylcysteine decarboxylase/phosphopantothenate--cysteine ligase
MADNASLIGKRITLCATGSVAAYRAADICSKLVQAGATVLPLMTESATAFLHPRTLATLAGQPCYASLSEDDGGSTGIVHITRGQETDIILIAPASANTLANLAHGLCSDIVAATCLASTVPVVVSPAMNTQMWEHPATQANVALLMERGIHFIPTRHGQLACRAVGDGKIAETEDILSFLNALFASQLVLDEKPLNGKRVLITAGGTREPIDSVRYIGNASSGKMGAALAQAALDLGALVDVICGPGVVPMPTGVRRVDIRTTNDLLDKALLMAVDADIVIMAAAPADYRVANPVVGKHKKSDGPPVLDLVENPDVLRSLVADRRHDQLIVGFAAEVGDPVPEAIRKCADKGCDFVVGNNIATEHGAFGSETTELVLCSAQDVVQHFEPATKTIAAQLLMQLLASALLERPAALV